MARKPHKYHYIYKTTCSVTGRYYIGMHSTSNLEDDYLGSGKILRYSIRKHGKDKHNKEILDICSDRKSLAIKEREIVNESLLKDPLCMNLMKGGEGGRGFISTEQQANRSKIGGIARANHMKDDPDFSKLVNDKISKANLKRIEAGTHLSWKDNYSWIGKKHTAETKKKMKESHKDHGIGETNSQYGTKWITNGIDNKKIKDFDQIPEGWKNGRIVKWKGARVVDWACFENK